MKLYELISFLGFEYDNFNGTYTLTSNDIIYQLIIRGITGSNLLQIKEIDSNYDTIEVSGIIEGDDETLMMSIKEYFKDIIRDKTIEQVIYE